MTRKDVGRSDIVNELFKPVRRNFPRRRVELRSIDDLLQVDLAEVQKIASVNDSNRYILVAINCFSKKGYARPIRNKKATTVAEATANILDEANVAFKHCQTDQGSEFQGAFKKLLADRNIKHYHTFTGLKASICERFIRTLKQNLYRRMALRGSNRYIDILDEVLAAYNNRKHRTIKMSPNQVSRRNEKMLRETVYANYRPIVKAKYSIGDMVRVSKTKYIFDRGFHPSWTTQLYRIQRVNHKHPVTYTLSNFNGSEMVEGTFYEQELQRTKNPDVYLVEKIIRKRGNLVLVRWDGYSSEFDTWEKASSIYDVRSRRMRRRGRGRE